MKKTIVFNDKGLSGLNNIANTCYINTCCHLLSSTLPLSYYFLSDMYLDNTKKDYDNQLLTLIKITYSPICRTPDYFCMFRVIK